MTGRDRVLAACSVVHAAAYGRARAVTDLERDALYASMEVALGLRPPIMPLRREVLPARPVAWWRRLVPRLRSHRRARPQLTHGGPDAR